MVDEMKAGLCRCFVRDLLFDLLFGTEQPLIGAVVFRFSLFSFWFYVFDKVRARMLAILELSGRGAVANNGFCGHLQASFRHWVDLPEFRNV